MLKARGMWTLGGGRIWTWWDVERRQPSDSDTEAGYLCVLKWPLFASSIWKSGPVLWMEHMISCVESELLTAGIQDSSPKASWLLVGLLLLLLLLQKVFSNKILGVWYQHCGRSKSICISCSPTSRPMRFITPWTCCNNTPLL
jgi:hypothetical protein